LYKKKDQKEKAVLFLLQELKNNPDSVVTKAKEIVIAYIELNTTLINKIEVV
jgi:hypothetical protein